MPNKVQSAQSIASMAQAANRRELALRRGSACKRGYGRRWEKLRRLILARDPLCTIRHNVLVYLDANRSTFTASLLSELAPYIARLCHGMSLSNQVDHIVPKPAGDDSEGNLQGGCDSCHSLKTYMDQLCAQRGRGGFFSANVGRADRLAATRV